MSFQNMKPWQGAGTELPPDISAEQAMKLAKLDWDVETAPIITNDQKRTDVDRWRVTRRVQDNTILGVVHKGYKPIQNRDAFGLFDRVVSTGRMTPWTAAGELAGGSKVFIVSRLPGMMEIGKGVGPVDEVERYLLLANSHDGSYPLRMVFTPVRVMCENTLALALHTEKSGDKITKIAPQVAVKHTKGNELQMRVAEKTMGAALRYYEKFGDFAGCLYSKQLGSDQVRGIVETVFPPNKHKEVTPNIVGHRTSVERLFVEGKGHEKIAGSAWALLNAFAEYADHGYSLKKDKEGSVDFGARSKSIWMGGAKVLKNKATEAISKAVL